MRKLKFIDLFSGAGGRSEGLIRQRFKSIGHLEMNKDACDTIKTITAYHCLLVIKQTWLAQQLGNSYSMVNSYLQNRQQSGREVL
jgi:site-specific DNA-cytosine methylase